MEANELKYAVQHARKRSDDDNKIMLEHHVTGMLTNGRRATILELLIHTETDPNTRAVLETWLRELRKSEEDHHLYATAAAQVLQDFKRADERACQDADDAAHCETPTATHLPGPWDQPAD